jgi:hypothetical protein
VDYVNGAWFIAGNQGTMLISTNGTNWVNTGTITKNSLYGLVINNGQLVTVGTEGAIVRSQVIPPARRSTSTAMPATPARMFSSSPGNPINASISRP